MKIKKGGIKIFIAAHVQTFSYHTKFINLAEALCVTEGCNSGKRNSG
jgi:hypothetical protein